MVENERLNLQGFLIGIWTFLVDLVTHSSPPSPLVTATIPSKCIALHLFMYLSDDHFIPLNGRLAVRRYFHLVSRQSVSWGNKSTKFGRTAPHGTARHWTARITVSLVPWRTATSKHLLTKTRRLKRRLGSARKELAKFRFCRKEVVLRQLYALL